MSDSFISVNQTVLKKSQWQVFHPRYQDLQVSVYLSQGQKNAKHQKLILSIEIISEKQKIRFFNKFRTSDLPSQAITIFYDTQNLYQYIEEYQKDSSKIKFNPEQKTITIINVVIMKNKEIKQEIDLQLNKQKIHNQSMNKLNTSSISDKSVLSNSKISDVSSKQILEQSKLLVQSIIKDKNSQLETRINLLTEHMNNFVHQIRLLKNQNKVLSNALQQCNGSVLKLQRQSDQMKQKIAVIQRETCTLIESKKQQSKKVPVNHDTNIEELKQHVKDHQWHIDQLNNSFQNLTEDHSQFKKVKSKLQEHVRIQPQVLPLFSELKKQICTLNNRVNNFKQNQSKLGEKININLDFINNKYMENFRIVQNIIQKISGDEQRHQILGKENLSVFDIKKKLYFQVKILSSANSGFVIGIVSQTRKGERYSYDKKECICYDGKGFIFEQGQKIKMPTKLDNGQTIRVSIDPSQFLIQWYVGYTEIASTLIPESMTKLKLVPYLELYDKNDKIAING